MTNMKVSDFLVDAISEAVSTDYESADLIVEQVLKWAVEEGQQVVKEQVLSELCNMAEKEQVVSYRFSKQLGNYERTTFARDQLSELWFMSPELAAKYK